MFSSFFILVDVECLGTESGSEQEMQPANNQKPQSPQCECQCCAQPDTAHQLMDVTESKTIHSHLSKERQAGKLKSYSRKIQPCWYKKYPWITVCTSKYKVFCVSCRSAKQQGLLTFTKHQNSAFVDQGFGSWNKAIERFNDHERSEMHKEAVERLAAKSSSADVVTQLRIVKWINAFIGRC